MITIYGTTTHPDGGTVSFKDNVIVTTPGDITALVLAHMASRRDAWLWLGVEITVTFKLVIP